MALSSKITIYPPSPSHIRKLEGKFGLQQDRFNDYNFQTLYHLYYKKNESEVTYIGIVKILKKGQTEKDGIQITEDFLKLSEQYCSAGASLDYYQRLNKIPKADRNRITRALNDVVAYPELQIQFSSEPGWEKSVFRDNSQWKIFLNDAETLFQGNFDAAATIEDIFEFQPFGNSDDLQLDFSAPIPENYESPQTKATPLDRRAILPQRVIVLIGRNGSGKSTLLSRIAHVAYASPEERRLPEIKNLGELYPEGIGFTRVITVSYSAFDSFRVPGTAEKSLSQTLKDVDSGDGRFVYCGLRDIVTEAKIELDENHINDKYNNTPHTEERKLLPERRSITRLKSIDKLAEEFERLIKSIRKSEKQTLLLAALQPLLQDPSFSELAEEGENIFKRKISESFLSWSTGHKIALHVIASLVAHAAPKSLILFDEPEMHLHPPLAAALMHSVRLILEEVNAFCIIATHSPVLLQETLTKHVKIIERFDTKLTINAPKLETFGENVGTLTYTSFGLTASTTDFHNTLDLLTTGAADLKSINKLFTPGLSGQALSYVMSRLARREANK